MGRDRQQEFGPPVAARSASGVKGEANAHRPLLVTLTVAILSLLLLTTATPAGAHAELVRAEPPVDGLLAAAPQRLELWFSERVDEGAGSPAITVLDESGDEVEVRDVRIDADDARHVLVDLPQLDTGTFTVVWTVRSADDGHTLSGSYAFRVGTGRAPGAATVQGETPQPWAVATRWLTFLGVALAAGGFFYNRVILPGASAEVGQARRRTLVVVFGAAVALFATLAEPVLQTMWPPAGTLAPSLVDALRGLPDGWWLRPVALFPLALLGLLLVARRDRRASPLLEWVGLALALIALLGLSLTSHAAARSDWRVIATASNIMHQWSVALWVGGLAHLAFAWPGLRQDQQPEPQPLPQQLSPITHHPLPITPAVRQFSRIALGLVIIGIGTGVANAGLVLPTLQSLWESTYGVTLIVKVAVLAVPLGLATFHRTALRRVVAEVSGAFRVTVRLESTAVLLVVLGGSILALLAPPVLQAGNMTEVDLLAPATTAGGDEIATVRLKIEPVRQGENTIDVLLTDSGETPLPPSASTLISLGFTSLDHGVRLERVGAEPNDAGGFTAAGLQLSLDGWWRIDVTVRHDGNEPAVAPFYLLLPDPNIHGSNAPRIPDTTEEAQVVFERGLEGQISLRSVRWMERLSGGTGTVVMSAYAVSDGSDGQPPAFSRTIGDRSTITIGDQSWLRQEAGPWLERPAATVFVPSDWGETYEGATGINLGITEEINGESAQFISFYLPEKERQSEAWFAWWVGIETGRVHRETMVARAHYMVTNFADFNAPITIDPPSDVAPSATPASTPESEIDG